MNKKLLILLITFASGQLYSIPEQPHFEQPEFKNPFHLFSERNLVQRLKLEEAAAQEFPDQSTLSKAIAFLNKHITPSNISHNDCTGRQVPEIGYDQQRKKIYSGEQAEPTHIVLTFSGKPTLQDTIEILQKNRLAHNFIIDTDGSIHPVTAQGESVEDALKHRPFAVGVAGKVVDGEYEERDMNAVSLTISVVGPNTKSATPEQEEALLKLVGWLSNKFKIKPYNVVDYGTVALPYGRRYTQENLPWKKLAAQGLTIWPKDTKIYNQRLDLKHKNCILFISAALRKIGYLTPVTSNEENNTFKQALITFQKHYKCESSNGELTEEVVFKINDILKQMETINPELKHIWPPARFSSKK